MRGRLTRRLRSVVGRSVRSRARERRGVVVVGKTATMIRGDYGKNEDQFRRYQD